MIKRSNKWYEARLSLYFERTFGAYEETAEWHINPAPNKWKFNIPELEFTVTLTCDNRGRVTETREKLPPL